MSLLHGVWFHGIFLALLPGLVPAARISHAQDMLHLEQRNTLAVSKAPPLEAEAAKAQTADRATVRTLELQTKAEPGPIFVKPQPLSPNDEGPNTPSLGTPSNEDALPRHSDAAGSTAGSSPVPPPSKSEEPGPPSPGTPLKEDAEALHGDPAGATSSSSLFGAWTPMSTWKPMWHEYLLLFWLHFAFAGAATYLTLRHPVTLLLLIAASGLLWPLSWATGQHLWDGDHRPLSANWWMTFIKWVIVDAAAGIPVLFIRAFLMHRDWLVGYSSAPERVREVIGWLDEKSDTWPQRIGYFIYVILGANILWTMFYKVDGWVRMWNTFVGGALVTSLAVYCVALYKHDKPLLEVRNSLPYGRATPLAWLLCYTVWNAMFVADYSMGMTLQDFEFWAMMYLMQHLDKEPMTVDLYFALVRPVQLSVYIALGCWMGIVPFFANAVPLDTVTHLSVNSHTYFLFLNMANFALGSYCIGFSIKAWLQGPPHLPSQKRLTVAEQ